MRIKASFGFLVCFFEAILLAQLFGFPSLLEMHLQAHISEQPIQMVFANLDRTKGKIPCAFFPSSGDRLHILYHRIR
ncbi:hypothetical protein KDH_17560 [Dictyobacter sp. S3.2.2.5]|uniref:Secreted protein n=1 Tax=Dictyobacter halimunensis TaxID=3026934 RepID=A0ABQ6FMG2_9CHLR|nr:hypothetical protein KDH_17560 [Dictyobacter sp. S3.2.2.5]